MPRCPTVSSANHPPAEAGSRRGLYLRKGEGPTVRRVGAMASDAFVCPWVGNLVSRAVPSVCRGKCTFHSSVARTGWLAVKNHFLKSSPFPLRATDSYTPAGTFRAFVLYVSVPASPSVSSSRESVCFLITYRALPALSRFGSRETLSSLWQKQPASAPLFLLSTKSRVLCWLAVPDRAQG